MRCFLPLLTIALAIGLAMGQCPTWEFTCKNGDCIPKRERCDGEPDCFDRSDETGCPFACRQKGAVLPAIRGTGSEVCYWVTTSRVNYTEAISLCKQHDSILAEPLTYTGCHWINYALSYQYLDIYHPLWIGIHDDGTKGEHWYGQTDMTELDPNAGRMRDGNCWKNADWGETASDYMERNPTNRDRSCTVYVTHSGEQYGGWLPVPCDIKRQALCQQVVEGCHPDYMKCPGAAEDAIDECMLKTFLCDGPEDCLDGSDEESCDYIYDSEDSRKTTTEENSKLTKDSYIWIILPVIFTVLLIAGCCCLRASKKKEENENNENQIEMESKKRKKKSFFNVFASPDAPESSVNTKTVATTDEAMSILEQEFERLNKKKTQGEGSSSDSNREPNPSVIYGRKDGSEKSSNKSEKSSDDVQWRIKWGV